MQLFLNADYQLFPHPHKLFLNFAKPPNFSCTTFYRGVFTCFFMCINNKMIREIIFICHSWWEACSIGSHSYVSNCIQGSLCPLEVLQEDNETSFTASPQKVLSSRPCAALLSRSHPSETVIRSIKLFSMHSLRCKIHSDMTRWHSSRLFI